HEAIRLTSMLAEHAAGNRPETHALLALMLLNAARIPTRMDDEGNLLLLKEQNRAHWNQGMIARGMFHFARSAAGELVTVYHIQAGIAACHCAAKDYASTDWPRILSFYDRLAELDGSPIVALNRAVAVAQVRGPMAGIEAVAAIRDRRTSDDYSLLHAVLADFALQLSHREAPATHFRQALGLIQ